MIKHHIPEEFEAIKYRRFAVGIHFPGRVYGGLPNDEDLVRKWYEAKQPGQDPDETTSELDINEEMSKMRSVFRRDMEGKYFDKHLYLAAHQAKAMIKQCASLLKITTLKRGSKQSLSEGMRVRGRVTLTEDNKAVEYLTGDKIFFQPTLTKPTGLETITGHVTGPQGPRSIIKICEYVENSYIQFELSLLPMRMGDRSNSRDITPQDVYEMIFQGQTTGLGSNRSMDSGQFEVVQFEEITNRPIIPDFWRELNE